ncbi:hypothetical protein Bca101_052711 [Brassica carinata]
MERLFYGRRAGNKKEESFGSRRREPRVRDDGWMEIEIGEFETGREGGEDKEVVMSVTEVVGYQLKGGIVIDGIEVRPKTPKNKMMMLPEACVANILSFTTPADTFSSASVSSVFQLAGDSDFVWEKFLPSGYSHVISTSTHRLNFSSKKELYRCLCESVLIDNGRKITGKIQTGALSPNTSYGAYLIMKVTDRAYGLDLVPAETWIKVGNGEKETNTSNLSCLDDKKQLMERLFYGHREQRMMATKEPRVRGDGWMEIEIGEFETGREGGDSKEVVMSLTEVKGYQLKGGIVIDGIEVRPKPQK